MSRDTHKAAQEHHEALRDAELRKFCEQFTVGLSADTWMEM
jgi:hypothetical protein